MHAHIICLLMATILLSVSAQAGDEQIWQEIRLGGGDTSVLRSWRPQFGTLDGQPMMPDGEPGDMKQPKALAKNAVYSLATPHGDYKRVWAMSADGLYKTEDFGQSWTYVHASSPRKWQICNSSFDAVRPIAVDPQDGAIAFAGTDDGRLYRTANGGEAWIECIYTPITPGRETWRPGVISSISFAADNPALIIITNTTKGAFRSDDAGKSWRKLGDLPTPLHISITPGRHETLWASCAEDGLWRSDDGGATFTRVALNLLNPYIRETAIAHNRPGTMYAIGSSSHDGILLCSEDGGSSWTAIQRLSTDSKMPRLTNVAINLSDPNLVLCASNWNTFSYRVGEKKLGDFGSDARPYATELLLNDRRFYASTCASGLFQSTVDLAFWRQLVNPGINQSWNMRICRIGIVQYRGERCILATAVKDEGKGGIFVLIIGQDGRIIEKSSQGLPMEGNGMETLWGFSCPRGLAVFPADPRIVYLGIDGENGGLFRSDDGGRTWRKTPGNPGSMRLYEGLAVDPHDASRVYWGTRNPGAGVYLSSDAGETWQKVLEDDVITLHTAESGFAYAGGTNLHLSQDGGRTWKTLTNLSKESLIDSIATDPHDDKRIWFTQSDPLDKRQWTHIWQTTDGGSTWTEITKNYRGSNGLKLCYDPQEDALYGALFSVFKLNVSSMQSTDRLRSVTK